MSELRVTAYRYSLDRGLPCDLDSLAALGLAAACEGRWLGIPELKVPEGPELIVHTWPERVWDAAVTHYRELTDAEEAAENATWD